MNSYESVFIYHPHISEKDVKKESKKVEEFLSTRGVQNIVTNYSGKKEIPFALKKQRSGHYVFLSYDVEHMSALEDLTGQLRIEDSIIKFQTHRVNKKMRRKDEIAMKRRPKRKIVEEPEDDGSYDY